jgi:hypothetical protein
MEIFDDLSKLAGDFSFLLFFVAIAVGAGFFFGRTKLLSIMIDVYIARALVAVVPSDWIASVAYSETILFLLIFGFLFLVDQRLFDLHISGRGADFFWRVGVMGVLITGMVASSLFVYLPKDFVQSYISASLYGYFTEDVWQMFWMTAPLLALMFINRRLRD